jgi:uncharacterized membrane protein YbaN (DUF454 family)
LKYIYLTLAFFFLGLAIFGVALPVLPTTPFLLLASFFFAKGSKRFHQWFMKSWIYKKYLTDYLQKGGMSKATKLKILLISTPLMITAIFLAPIWHAQVAIIGAIVVKYWYFLFRIKSL